MAQQIVLPKLGLTMQEGVIGEWLATPGQRIGMGDVLLRLETDKVEVDVEAEAEGFLATNAKAGDVLPVGAVIGWLLGEGEQAPDGAAPAAAAEDVVAPEAEPAALATAAAVSGDGTRLKASPNARRVAAESNVDLTAVRGTGPGGRIVSEDVEEFLAAAPAAVAPVAAASEPAGESAGQFVGPLVRRRAAELGVDLAKIVGTGIGGRVTKADVEKAAGSSAAAAPSAASAQPAPVSGPQPGEVIPLTGMRGAIARNMVDSLQTMAQLTHGYEADVTALVAARAQLKAEAGESGAKAPSLNDFIMKAVAVALQQHPLLNAGIADDKITLFSEINLGVAVAVEGGLIVPVVKGADALSVGEIAGRTGALAAAARTGKLAMADMEGATFSVSTLGAYGVDFFTPVINPGNVAILGVGRAKDGFRWEGETPVKTQVLTLSLTFDHRAVDGAPAAEFLRTLSAVLSRPLSLLAG
ncbi:pyruvate dehydrogenase E2 component (dihydrolipoamide acetyltransferase) [Williamsia limnetica]|uniref:Dihydrolipoamide acetyltransferase component of pyruvate dehydrogenase complex n=1 Tax=Williamsia limnetica TaxID=882452 RepID=A0A318RF47_WILLI|nr:dihydrolipoamide acetyltransferase family protein [Williamsia limnetica]PYE12824.1 pyruvate dehydrogenase E2 component (dihydrolipoamide acetyltransferase) [Williamsia limnetica]